jgi:hypothetical protein
VAEKCSQPCPSAVCPPCCPTGIGGQRGWISAPVDLKRSIRRRHWWCPATIRSRPSPIPEASTCRSAASSIVLTSRSPYYNPLVCHRLHPHSYLMVLATTIPDFLSYSLASLFGFSTSSSSSPGPSSYPALTASPFLGSPLLLWSPSHLPRVILPPRPALAISPPPSPITDS